MAITPRELIRQQDARFEELGLADPTLTDAELIEAIVKNPILMNRPIVETGKGVRLCRPPELVHEILLSGQKTVRTNGRFSTPSPDKSCEFRLSSPHSKIRSQE